MENKIERLEIENTIERLEGHKLEKENIFDVLIMQTYKEPLERIMTLAKNSSLKIGYGTNPNDALFLAPNYKFLITGQFFYGNYNKDIMMEFSELEKELYGDLQDGNILAKKVKEINPQIVPLRFSLTPQAKDYFCGDIEKLTYEPIKELLNSKEFAHSLKTNQKEDLPKIKGVNWYLDNFPKSWK